MADAPENMFDRDPKDIDLNAVDRPYAEEAPEVEEDDQPRRAASARFIVDSEIGSEALLRDAMDPANQSLAEALRLSFRVLQAVIVILVVLFLASGFRTVDDGHSGVRTLWGKIQESLSPGPKFSLAPYPAGEFVTFKAENRDVNLGETFAMASRGRSQEQMLEQTEVFTTIRPGVDGEVITRDGDIAHLTELSARYEIDQPITFVHALDDASADAVVKMAVQRAAVHVCGTMSLQELTDPGRVPEMKDKMRLAAQHVLDEIDAGVRLVDIPNLSPAAPLAIQKAITAVQTAQVEASQTVLEAQRQANKVLSSMAGANYQEMLDLIDIYEQALDAGDQAKSAELIASINAKLDSPEVAGEISQIIGRARAYQTLIDSTLGSEYQRFAGLLPAFRNNPQLVVREEWLRAYQEIMSRPDVEVISLPLTGTPVTLSLVGSAEIADFRRNARVKEKEAETNARNQRGPIVLSGEDMSLDRPGRQLNVGPGGQVTGKP